jgi:threonine dehydratase
VHTIADGLSAPIAGELTLAAVERFVDEVVLVSDAEIAEAMTLLLQYAKLLVEPAGAAGVAALLAGRGAPSRGGRAVALLSGGNVDLSLLKDLL